MDKKMEDMTNYYFKIKNKTNYTEKTVWIVERDIFRAKKELNRCYPNWSEVSVSFTLQNFESPTEKQLNYISFIEENTGIKFGGVTKQEASKYIQENKEKVRVNPIIELQC